MGAFKHRRPKLAGDSSLKETCLKLLTQGVPALGPHSHGSCAQFLEAPRTNVRSTAFSCKAKCHLQLGPSSCWLPYQKVTFGEGASGVASTLLKERPPCPGEALAVCLRRFKALRVWGFSGSLAPNSSSLILTTHLGAKYEAWSQPQHAPYTLLDKKIPHEPWSKLLLQAIVMVLVKKTPQRVHTPSNIDEPTLSPLNQAVDQAPYLDLRRFV